MPASPIFFRDVVDGGGEVGGLAGIGIGFVAVWDQDGTEDLVEVLPSLEDWSAKIWLVTHMDLHRTAKVQTFVRFLKEQVKSWPVD